MRDKIEKKKKIRKIGVLVAFGMLMLIMMAPTVSADETDWSNTGDSWESDQYLGSLDANDVIFVTGVGTNQRMRIISGGNIGIGSDTTPDAMLEIAENSITPFMISNGVDGDGDFVIVDTSGNVGIGTVSPTTARLDVADASDALRLRAGDNSDQFGDNQIILSWTGGTQFSHAIKTRHHSLQDANNAIDFFVWDYGTDDPNDIGTKHVMTIDSAGDGRVGIGTTHPDNTLEIRSTTSPQLRITYTDSLDYATFGVVDANARLDITTVDFGGTSGHINLMPDGNVGIGTTAPRSKLSVSGEVTIGNTWASSQQAPSNGLAVEGDVGIGLYSTSAKLHIVQDAATDVLRAEDRSGDTTPFVIDQNGNVGIGVSVPEDKLEIDGDIRFDIGASSIYMETSPPNSAGGWLTVRAGDANYASGMTGFVGGNLLLYGGDGGGTGPYSGDGGNVYIYGGALAGEPADEGDVILAHTVLDPLGKVGIRTSRPEAELHVEGTIRVDQKIMADDSGGLELATSDETTRLFIENTGDIGIGTPGPDAKLHIYDSGTSGNRKGLYVVQDGAVSGYGIYVEKTGASTTNVAAYLSATGATNNYGLLVGNGKVSIGTSGFPSYMLTVSSDDNDDTLLLLGPDGINPVSYGARISFGADGDYAYIEEDENDKLYIYGGVRTAIMGGNVGIGTTSPDTPLHVLTDNANTNVDLVTFDRTKETPADGDSYDIIFNHQNSNVEQVAFAQITLIANDVADGTEDGELSFSVIDDGSLNVAMRIDEDGKVGIGTGQPQRLLHLEGSGSADPPLRYDCTTGSGKEELDKYIPIDVNGDETIYYIKLYQTPEP